MTHSLAHWDGRGSNKRMRSLGSQDLATRGVDMLPVQKSAKHCGCPHPVRSADPARPQLLCRVRGCGNVQNCREFPQNRFCRRPVPPARAGVWGAKQLCNATRGHRTLHHVNWRTDQHQQWFNWDIYTHRYLQHRFLCVTVCRVDVCGCV